MPRVRDPKTGMFVATSPKTEVTTTPEKVAAKIAAIQRVFLSIPLKEWKAIRKALVKLAINGDTEALKLISDMVMGNSQLRYEKETSHTESGSTETIDSEL